MGKPVFWGLVFWLVQPLYFVTEIVTAGRVTVPYSFVGNTISELGAVTCTTFGEPPLGPYAVCSPWHAFMNTSFVVSGVLLAAGAVLLRPQLPAGRTTTTAVVLYVIGGLTSIGTGLVPMDQNLALHSLVSGPGFLVQPLALILLGLALRRTRAIFGWSTIAVGVASLAGAVAFSINPGGAGHGFFERLSLWPANIWATALAILIISAMPRPERLVRGGRD
ncbi:DUF998 domain-containing protein [Kribbella antibiotica]|uniref:DUF998 domain-containing protein n=1 Tax=Kribbella antibiotica TaxID=190195 RepID=A0A4R4YU82_9ACTN|nr:DUF998 domain-containing protein [Kribbella antibiotica]TDD48290.1 DUF998 domain-containing protein [Kribbella antibiotica]